ncbi:GGDEF domain-containing protein [Frankia sp. AiPa1]|nr:GGDEF domain-containing protein [Frankia sp. AiPa1]
MGPLFAAGGAAGRVLATKDWSTTTLRAPGDWSPSLRTAVCTCLESRFPMIVMWGPELAYLYNEPCIPNLGDKHPDAMGMPLRWVWPEIWDELGPLSAQVMAGNGATWSANKRLLIRRHGYLEEAYFTFSFGPIREMSDGGRIAGVLSTYQETTREVIRSRRLACQRELTAALARLRTQRSICSRAPTVLGRYPEDVPYSLVVLWGRAPSLAAPRLVAASGLGGRQMTRAALAALDRGRVVPEVVQATSLGGGRVVSRLPGWETVLLAGGSPAPSTAVAVSLRNRTSAMPVGLLLVGASDLLALDQDYQDFVETIGGQISLGLMLARAREAERAHAASARHSSLHDALTGLPNRASFLGSLGRALIRSQRGAERVAVLFIDLDGFKAVNDALGHRAGDDLLREVATRLRPTVRPADVVSRFAGDEFAVLCKRMTTMGEVETIAGHVVEALRLPGRGGGLTATASVGVALSGPGLVDPGELLDAADIAMYAAKRQGRGRYVLYEESMRS